MIKPLKKLGPQHEAFVDEYVKLGRRNADQAALSAGFKAEGYGRKLVRDPLVRKAIDERMAEAAEEAKVYAAEILQEERRLAFFDPRDLVDENGNPKPLNELDEDTARAIAGLDVTVRKDEDATEITYKYKFAPKGAALDRLEHLVGMRQEADRQAKVEVSGEILLKWADE